MEKEYRNDEAATDAKYKNKILLVRGTLFAHLTVMNQHAVNLPRGWIFGLKPGGVNGADSALPGQMMRIRGRYTGSKIFDDCDVVSITPVNFIKITADELLIESEIKQKEITKKYIDKNTSEGTYMYLHVTGARASEVGKGFVDLTAPKGAKLRLRANYRPEGAKQFANLKVGDTVSIKGASYFDGTGVTVNHVTIVP